MNNLELTKKKSTAEMINVQNSMLMTNLVPRTENYLDIENTILDSSLKQNQDNPLLDANVWQVVEIPTPSISSSKREPIDLALQSLSQKVMKRIWDNKEDEFWDTY